MKLENRHKIEAMKIISEYPSDSQIYGRVLILLEAEREDRITVVAKNLGISYSKANCWVKRYEREKDGRSLVQILETRNRDDLTNDEIMCVRKLHETYPCLSVRELTNLLEAIGIQISHTSVYKVIHQ